MALIGTLEDVNFAEIVQVINQGRKTGELVVRRIQEEARVYFWQGEIVQASLRLPAPMEAILGAEVVYRLLGWRAGEFEFQRSTHHRARQLQETTDELILEGMKRLDEWEKVTSEVTDLDVVLRIKAGNVGEHYEELSDDARIILRLIDARRDVSTIIRECGFDPARAMLAITELFAHEAVEKWDQPASKEMPAAAGVLK